MDSLSKLIVICMVSLIVLFLYMNNGSMTTKYYQFDDISSFDCSDYNQNEIYFFIPKDTGSLSSQYSYVFKSTKDGKVVDIGVYETRAVLGRHLVSNFWQKPEPHYISPIFSTGYYSDSTKPIRLDYKLVNKAGYGISESSFSDIGDEGYIQLTISDNGLDLKDSICPKVEVDYSLLSSIQDEFGHY